MDVAHGSDSIRYNPMVPNRKNLVTPEIASMIRPILQTIVSFFGGEGGGY